ncbi:MAG: hypothetical protein GC162_18510 [Planctomycetes bacterium]|nr:hypothetical protein [Planctomycetota bacterium]
MMRCVVMMFFISALAALSAGCSSGYTLRGKVVTGPEALVSIVPADDPRLAGPGVESATIELTLDPRSLGRRVLSTNAAYGDGQFQIPVQEFGAGVLDYELGVLVRANGYAPTAGIFRLGSQDLRLLIVMTKGQDRDPRGEDPFKDIDRYLPK